jgi:chromosome segregation ATPase
LCYIHGMEPIAQTKAELEAVTAEVQALDARYENQLRRYNLRRDRRDQELREISEQIDALEMKRDELDRQHADRINKIWIGGGLQHHHAAASPLRAKEAALRANLEELVALAELATGVTQRVRIVRDCWASNGLRIRSGATVALPVSEARRFIMAGAASPE